MSITITTTGGIVSMLPGCLGFVPQDSILVALTRSDPASGSAQAKVVLRGDLNVPGLTGMVEGIGDAVDGSGCDQAAVVIVGTVERSVAETTASAVADRLAECGVQTLLRVTVPAIEQAAQWIDLDSAECGTLDDPRTTDLALAQMETGQVLAGSRGAVVDELAPAAEQQVVQLQRKLAPLAENDAEPSLRTVVADIANGDCGVAALAHTANTLEWLPTVRDSLMGLAILDLSEKALAHLLAVARLAGSSDAYVLVAFYEGVRGNSVRAQIAVTHALRLDPLHRLAGLLDRAFAAAVTPEYLRALAETGIDVAHGLGVALA